MPFLHTSAGAIAKERLEKYVTEKLTESWDECAWEFYTFLLEQAKKHPVDYSGYASPAYLKDHGEAIKNTKLLQEKREKETAASCV